MNHKYLSFVFLLSITTPAFAWTNTNTGPGPKQIVDGGPGAQATARQGQIQGQAQRQSATGGRANSSASGNNVNLYGAQGSGSGGGGNGGGGVIGGLGITVPEGFGNAPCGGGIGLGGLGLSGGGSGGGTLWEFGECKIMRESNALRVLGYPDAAVAELCQIDRVRKAFGGTCPSGGIDNTKYPFDYCATRNAGDVNQHLECDRKISGR